MMTFINKKISQYDQCLQQYPLGHHQNNPHPESQFHHHYEIPNPNFLKYFENQY